MLFVGAVLPDAECVRNVICNAAGNKFQKSFVAAVRDAMQTDIDIISYEPARLFRHGPKVVYRAMERELKTDCAPNTRDFSIAVPNRSADGLDVFMIALARTQPRRQRGHSVQRVHPHAPRRSPRAQICVRPRGLVADLPHGLYAFKGVVGLLQRRMKIQTGSIRR
jgi:hypothetical protein